MTEEEEEKEDRDDRCLVGAHDPFFSPASGLLVHGSKRGIHLFVYANDNISYYWCWPSWYFTVRGGVPSFGGEYE